MKKEDAEEYTQSLGQIVGGSWRQIALAKRLGVPQALGLTVDKWVNERLSGYVRMSIPDRREAVAELSKDGHSIREIAEITGAKKSTVGNDVQFWTAVDAVAALAADDSTRATAKATETRQTNEDKRKADLFRPVTVALAPGLQHGDFRELSDQIKDASVQLVFTDPPYDRESIDLYDDAARVARRILKPGGSFIAYSGQRHLPDVLTACARHLDYWWTIAGVHGGGNQVLEKLGIRCGWKPLVWFVKTTRGDVQNVLLDVVEGDREKDAHQWQQAECEALYFIEKLTSPDGIIVDFFAGGGTTAAAAKKLGRHWIGFEVDASAIERASQRITETAAA